jgi:predicted transcriptional regulator
MLMEVKEVTRKKDFYLSILNKLKETTNLSKLRKDLNISKQNLNYYLRRLKKEGLIENDSYGSWKLTGKSKNPSNHEKLLSKDSVRGHGVVVSLNLPKEIKGYENRTEIIKKKGIHFKLVGAKENTPRIKVLGRKVWLCNNSIRIYDKPNESYYGNNAIESRVLAFRELKKIVSILENKLGIKLNPTDIEFKKEHFALIKNDLAIEQNRKGEILKVSDEDGEWLIVDDSLGKGGELETIGKKALVTNIPMKNWWNENKEDKFFWSSPKIGHAFEKTNEMINQVTQNQMMFNQNFESHVQSIKSLGNSAEANAVSVELLSSVVRELKDEITNLRNEISNLKDESK